MGRKQQNSPAEEGPSNLPTLLLNLPLFCWFSQPSLLTMATSRHLSCFLCSTPYSFPTHTASNFALCTHRSLLPKQSCSLGACWALASCIFLFPFRVVSWGRFTLLLPLIVMKAMNLAVFLNLFWETGPSPLAVRMPSDGSEWF